MTEHMDQIPGSDPVYLMGALERLEKGQALRPVDWQELSTAVGRVEAERLRTEAEKARHTRLPGLHTGRTPLPPVLMRLLLRVRSQVVLLSAPREAPGRLVRRIGRRQARRIDRMITRSTASRARALDRHRRRGRR